ncbi:hypothetical protein Mpsy_2404 [Methanolobus psychrophilus R15]|nr:hypothetical protein Mpsy_2404 [Methanolobus psychrophilus R15]
MVFQKKSYIILVLSSILPIFLYFGAIDPFAPLHTVPISEIIYFGHMNDNLINKAPAFYIFGSVISLITGILPENLIYLPIQLIPSILLCFVLFRKMADSSIIGSLLTLIYSISDISGNKFFFWIHGLGLILLFLIIYLLIKKLENMNTPRYSILLFISIFSLIYTSYDITFQISIILVGIILALFINNESRKSIKSYFNAFLFLLLVQLGLSNFVYSTLVNEFNSTGNYIGSIEIFLFSFFSSTNNDFILKDIAITYPRIIGLISVMKYIILGFSIVIALALVYNGYNKHKNLEYFSIIFGSFILTSIAYILAKLAFGQFAIGIIFFPGIISICLIHRLLKAERVFNKVALLMVLAILVLSSYNYASFYDNDFINIDDNCFTYVDSSAYWYEKYSSGIGASDIQTNNLYYMHMSKKIIQTGGSLGQVHSYFTALDPYTNIYPVNNSISANVDYYILNNRLNTISIEKWIILKPWIHFDDEIETNQNLNKIYTSKDMVILARRTF